MTDLGIESLQRKDKMKTYCIKIGQYTGRKMNWQLHHEFFVNSENSSSELHSAYEKQYSGFQVIINEIEVVKVVSTDSKNKVGELVKTVVEETGKSEWSYEDAKYVAKIPVREIDGYKEIMKPLWDAQKTVNDEKKMAIERISSMFNLKRVDQFSFNGDYVRFIYYGSWFNFKGE